MNINMNGLNDRKRNEVNKAIGAQSFWNIRKNENFQEKIEKMEISNF